MSLYILQFACDESILSAVIVSLGINIIMYFKSAQCILVLDSIIYFLELYPLVLSISGT